MAKKLSFTVVCSEKLEREIELEPAESNFQLYESDKLVLKDSGVELSLHLWLDVS